jgi:hypothetical protein
MGKGKTKPFRFLTCAAVPTDDVEDGEEKENCPTAYQRMSEK